MSPRIEEAEVFPVLRGKVALVTGASQGMGKATARVFLKAGAKLVICDIKEDKGKETEKELSEFGEVVFVKADVSKSDEVENLVSQTVARFSRLDVAVNNAAMTADDKALTDFDESHWNKILNVNLTGTALCCKYEMQQMIKQGGKGAIVNISSTNAFKPPRNMPAYSASKIAVIGLTKHAAMEGGSHGIRVNCVAPGAIYVSYSFVIVTPFLVFSLPPLIKSWRTYSFLYRQTCFWLLL